MMAPEIQHGQDGDEIDRIATALERHVRDAHRVMRRLLLRRLWQAVTGFWRAGGDRSCWMLPGTILLTVIFGLAASYGMNLWNRAIFDALERRDAATVLFWSLVYFPLLTTSVCIVVMQVHARMTMQRRWLRPGSHKVNHASV